MKHIKLVHLGLLRSDRYYESKIINDQRDFIMNYIKTIDKSKINLYNYNDLTWRWNFMKRTYQPNNRKKAKKHGFFARCKTAILNKRRKKGRKKIIH